MFIRESHFIFRLQSLTHNFYFLRIAAGAVIGEDGVKRDFEDTYPEFIGDLKTHALGFAGQSIRTCIYFFVNQLH
jgi:hypothetical protein